MWHDMNQILKLLRCSNFHAEFEIVKRIEICAFKCCNIELNILQLDQGYQEFAARMDMSKCKLVLQRNFFSEVPMSLF